MRVCRNQPSAPRRERESCCEWLWPSCPPDRCSWSEKFTKRRRVRVVRGYYRPRDDGVRFRPIPRKCNQPGSERHACLKSRLKQSQNACDADQKLRDIGARGMVRHILEKAAHMVEVVTIGHWVGGDHLVAQHVRSGGAALRRQVA